jgi:hypothetical protein
MQTVEYEAWVNGRNAAVHGVRNLPLIEDFTEWMDGFEMGCAELGERHLTNLRLGEYLIDIMRGIYAQIADLL